MSAQTLQDILAEFVEKPPGSVGVAVIGREMKELEAALGQSLESVDRAVVIGHPANYAMDPEVQRTAEEINTLLSHIGLLGRALADGRSHMLVFEDTCKPSANFSLDRLRAYFRAVKVFSDKYRVEGSDEFLLIGLSGCYRWKSLTQELKATNKFNGSYGYFIGRPMMEKLIETYQYLKWHKMVVPFDELMGLVLKAQRRWALCPENELSFLEIK